MEPIKKPFAVANVRDILDQYEREEISFSKMVEMLNEKAKDFYSPIPSIRKCQNCYYESSPANSEPCLSCVKSDEPYKYWQPK